MSGILQHFKHAAAGLLFVTVTGSFSHHARAQDISQTSLTWTVNQLLDQNNGEKIDYACTFETSRAQEIVWKQKAGAYVSKFLVQRVDGTWNDVFTDGKVIYHVTKGDQTGTLTFERIAQGLVIRLGLSQATGNLLKYQFTVSEVTFTN